MPSIPTLHELPVLYSLPVRMCLSCGLFPSACSFVQLHAEGPAEPLEDREGTIRRMWDLTRSHALCPHKFPYPLYIRTREDPPTLQTPSQLNHMWRDIPHIQGKSHRPNGGLRNLVTKTLPDESEILTFLNCSFIPYFKMRYSLFLDNDCNWTIWSTYYQVTLKNDYFSDRSSVQLYSQYVVIEATLLYLALFKCSLFSY